MKVMESMLADDVFISIESTVPAGSFPVYHSHNVYEIYILHSGTRNIFIGTKLYHTVPGDAALMQPYIPHRSFGKEAYTGLCIEFSDGYLAEHFQPKERSKLRECFETPIISIAPEILSDLWQKGEAAAGGEFDKKEYLLWVIEVLEQCRDATDIEGKRSLDSDASPIGVYLQEHYKEIKSLEQLTEHFGVSKSYLCRIFKQQTGLTIVEYINRLKVEEACDLLQKTEFPIQEISARCGFETVIYFNRVFKKIKGDTPKKLRKIAKEQWTFL